MDKDTETSALADGVAPEGTWGDRAIEFRVQFTGQTPFEQSRLCAQTLESLPVDAHDKRARVLAALSAAQLVAAPTLAAHTAALSLHEADLADTLTAQGFALLARCVTDLAPESLESRLADSRRALQIATATGDGELARNGYFMHLSALIEKGDVFALDSELMPSGATLSVFPELTDGRHANRFRCMRATLDGQTELAEQLADRAYEIATAAGDPDAAIVRTAQIAIIRWMQGRLSEMEPVFLQARQVFPTEPVWAASVAWIWLQGGRITAARGLINSLPDVDDFAKDRNWLAAVAILAEVSARVGDLELVNRLYSALAPFEHRLIPIGAGVICWGTVARPLALLAERQGKTDVAIAHLRTAVEVSSRIGAQAWLAQAQSELARLLVAHSGYSTEVGLLTSESLAAVEQLGLEFDLTAPATSEHEPRAAVSPTPLGGRSGVPHIRVLGTFEVRSAEGTLANWNSQKARTLLKILVARRGAPAHRERLMEALWPGIAPKKLENRFSVAVSAVRRALDPTRSFPSNTFLMLDRDVLSLRVHDLSVDVEEFLSLANQASSPEGVEFDELKTCIATTPCETLTDEPDEPWAEQLRAQVHGAFGGAAHRLAELALDRDDHLVRVESYRRILNLDQYDQVAHEGLIDALTRLGAHGQATAAKAHFHQQMAALGIAVND